MSEYVQIVDRKHPHYPETGWWIGHVVHLLGDEDAAMGEIKLDGCKHGTDGCFVAPGQIKQILEPRR